MSEGLKPCPFCGRSAINKIAKIGGYVVVCSGGIKCPVQPCAHAPSQEDSKKLWNTRSRNE